MTFARLTSAVGAHDALIGTIDGERHDGFDKFEIMKYPLVLVVVGKRPRVSDISTYKEPAPREH